MHEPCGCALSLNCSFDKTKNKHNFAMIKMKKRNLKYIKKLEIIVMIQGNLETLLIAFAI